jgi:hypothetical protein
MLGRAALAVLGLFATGGVWWSGLMSSDTVTYDLPPSEVQARIEHANLPPFVFGEQEPQATMLSEPNRVTWVASEDGAEVMRYVIDLTPADRNRTKVHVALQGATDGKFGNVDQRIRGDRTLRNLYVTAMKEQVDSVLTGHPFRYSGISGPTAAATAAHMGQIAGWMDRAADAQHKRERENVDKAYRDAGVD